MKSRHTSGSEKYRMASSSVCGSLFVVSPFQQLQLTTYQLLCQVYCYLWQRGARGDFRLSVAPRSAMATRNDSCIKLKGPAGRRAPAGGQS